MTELSINQHDHIDFVVADQKTQHSIIQTQMGKNLE